MKVEKPREIAIRVLRRREEGGAFVEQLMEKELGHSQLSPVDRGLCQELVYGMVRWQDTLDWLVAQKTSHRPQNATLRLLLHLGLYQLFWLERIPNHAAVHETVELGKQLGLVSQAGFLNAILRGYAREREATLARLEKLRTTHPSTGNSHPRWLVDKWQARWGSPATMQLLQWDNTPPPVYARVNRLKTEGPALLAAWSQEGVEAEPRAWDWTGEGQVFELRSHPPLTQCASFQKGFFYVQDPSTMLAVRTLEAQPGEAILDLCAAPGGKTAYIAQAMQNRGRLSARDNQPERLQRLRENCARLGLTCVDFSEAGPGEKYDRVLVDAPCSNTGVLRRRVDLRWRLRPEEAARLSGVQVKLLEEAAAQVRPGGILLYSTCSLEAEENEGVVEMFLRPRPDFKLEFQRQLLPFVEGVDGAFVARFRQAG